ncbi:dTMP kinase [Candidatus Microgenomates bacterium]|nr:dTMP kinase [Candidatus Microgenomates bacterium]
MLTHPYPGFFVDIEGIDGAGQTTQVTLIAERLKEEGFKTAVTRAATKDTPIGGLIRQALNHQLKISIPTLEFLFAADHSERQEKEIEPVLEKSGIVLADRSIWSFVAFGALAADEEWLFSLAKNLYFPDLTIFLHVSPHVALKRIMTSRPLRELFEKEQTLIKVWQNYEKLAKEFSDKIVVIDGEKPIPVVTEEILRIIKENPKFKTLNTKQIQNFK